jgi:outer membrane protein assembly factor BamD (BamD/ComL family)
MPDWLKREPQIMAIDAYPDSLRAVSATKAFLEETLRCYQEDNFIWRGRMVLNENPNCILGLYLGARFAKTKLGNWAQQFFDQTIEHAVLVEFGFDVEPKQHLETELKRLSNNDTGLKFDSFDTLESPFLLIYLLRNASSQSARQTARSLFASYLLHNHGLIPALEQYRLLLLGAEPHDVDERTQLRIAQLLHQTGAVTDAERLLFSILDQTGSPRITRLTTQKPVQFQLALSQVRHASEAMADLSHQLRVSPQATGAILERAVGVYDAASVHGPFGIEIEPEKANLVRSFWQVKKKQVAKILSAEWDWARTRLTKLDNCSQQRNLEPVLFAALLLQYDSFEEVDRALGQLTDSQCATGQMCRLARFAQKVRRPYLARIALDNAAGQIETVGDNIQQLENIAKMYLKGNSHQKAVEIYQRIVDQVPDGNRAVKAQLALVDLYSRQLGQYDKAVEHCQKLLSKFADSPQASNVEFLVGKFTYLDKDYAAAVGHLDVFGQRNPDHPHVPEAMMLAALGRMGQGKTDEAIARFNEIIQEYPAGELAARSKFLIGYAQLSAQKYAQAVETFKQFIEQFPKSKHESQARAFVDRLSKLTQ